MSGETAGVASGGGDLAIGTDQSDYYEVSRLLSHSRPVRGRVIILVDGLPTTYAPGGTIIRPDAMRDELKATLTGVVLAMGAPQLSNEIIGHVDSVDLPAAGARVVFQNNVSYNEYRRVVVVTQSSLLGVIE